MNIKRDLSEIINNKINESNKIIVVFGARQVGKTTLVNDILNNINVKVCRINGDEIKYIDIFSSRDLNKLKLFTQGYDILFIDEAQRITNIDFSIFIKTYRSI